MNSRLANRAQTAKSEGNPTGPVKFSPSLFLCEKNAETLIFSIIFNPSTKVETLLFMQPEHSFGFQFAFMVIVLKGSHNDNAFFYVPESVVRLKRRKKDFRFLGNTTSAVFSC